jgi:hypothetical protein
MYMQIALLLVAMVEFVVKQYGQPGAQSTVRLQESLCCFASLLMLPALQAHATGRLQET